MSFDELGVRRGVSYVIPEPDVSTVLLLLDLVLLIASHTATLYSMV